jgi:predicted RNA binding protein YcfA (HicA-like mRNA interferase family)
MAIDDLQVLRDHVPTLFEFQRGNSAWDEGWLVAPVNDVETSSLDSVEASLVEPLSSSLTPGVDIETVAPERGAAQDALPRLPVVYSTSEPIPGAPIPEDYGGPPPPDALAFYLPFHYFPRHVWGIYLTYEGVQELRDVILSRSAGAIDPVQAWHAARVFLYGHEAFHHAVESFATRLEVDRREPLYRTGFERLYRRELSEGRSAEEALATGFGAQKAFSFAKRQGWNESAQHSLGSAVHRYILTLPDNYRAGIHYYSPGRDFDARRDKLAEDSRAECLGGLPFPAAIWRNAPHGFRGIANVTSRVNYIVRRSSPLALRHRLSQRFLSKRTVIRKLERLAGMVFEREGGNHELWRTADGHTIPIPRHRELKPGTVRNIVKQAGLNMSLEEFLAA